MTFYPRPPRGGRPIATSSSLSYHDFLSTSPAWGTTRLSTMRTMRELNFLSTSPAWGTTAHLVALLAAGKDFLSTSPAWGTTDSCDGTDASGSSFYPRPPRGGRLPKLNAGISHSALSIHVPRVGDDALSLSGSCGRHCFLSTSPAWGTTLTVMRASARGNTFYPRPPRGGRLWRFCTAVLPLPFLSTSPAWGTTAHTHGGDEDV